MRAPREKTPIFPIKKKKDRPATWAPRKTCFFLSETVSAHALGDSLLRGTPMGNSPLHFVRRCRLRDVPNQHVLFVDCYWCLLVVVGYWLFIIVHCFSLLLVVVCYLLLFVVGCWLLYVVCYLLFVDCSLPVVVCCFPTSWERRNRKYFRNRRNE